MTSKVGDVLHCPKPRLITFTSSNKSVTKVTDLNKRGDGYMGDNQPSVHTVVENKGVKPKA
jgi:hypothetical protein